MNRVVEQVLNRLRIIQLNLNKSEKAHLDFINKAPGELWDIILIQEPDITYLRHIQAPNRFNSVFPPDRLANSEVAVRSVIWVSSSLPTNSWKAVNILGNSDLTAIQITAGPRKITIFNIYNDCMHSTTLTCLHNFIQSRQSTLLGGTTAT